MRIDNGSIFSETTDLTFFIGERTMPNSYNVQFIDAKTLDYLFPRTYLSNILLTVGSGIVVNSDTISVRLGDYLYFNNGNIDVRLAGQTVSDVEMPGVVITQTTISSDASVYKVPTVKAVHDALDLKQDTLTFSAPLVKNNVTVSISAASKSAVGVVKIGDHIQVDENGVISILVASSDQLGIVQTDITVHDMTDGGQETAPENRVPTTQAVYNALLLKQDNLADSDTIKVINGNTLSVYPWTTVTDVGSASTISVSPGGVYTLDATTGTHTITTDAFASTLNGKDAQITIITGGTPSVVGSSNVIMLNELVANTTNYCTVHFQGGTAYVEVDRTNAGEPFYLNGVYRFDEWTDVWMDVWDFGDWTT